ncbi:MAG: hypothetical protein ACP5K0_06880 [Thermosulfidibacteraceae bacterium]
MKKSILLTAFIAFIISCGYRGEPLPPYIYTFPKNIEKVVIVRPDEVIIEVKYPDKYIEGRNITNMNLKVYKCKKSCEACKKIEEKSIKEQTFIFKDIYYTGNICYLLKGATSEDIEIPTVVAIIPNVEDWPKKPKIDIRQEKNVLTITSETEGILTLYKKLGREEHYSPDPITYFSKEYKDGNVKINESYCYVARNVKEEGHLRIESDESNEVCVNVVDLEAPSPVSSLTAIYKDGKVFLIWEKPQDPDLDGFIVYKEENGKLIRLNHEIIRVPMFIDEHMKKGVNRYAVTSIDANGNESEKRYIEIKIE